MRDAFRELSSEKDYRYWFDPFWVRAKPYRVRLKRGGSETIQLHVRNFNSRAQSHQIEIHTPEGLSSDIPRLEGKLAKRSRASFATRLHAAADAQVGIHLVAFDVTLDKTRFGERFDCIVQVEP